ncbi:MAG: PfkB family carbohydrate kinase [Planctomycetota bacterium]|nr:PfkB family carbohydrate kinase [Planctomycetota bacterium]
MPLVVTGTIGIDTVFTPTDRRERVLGGSAAYFAAAASFFTPVRVVAAVGGDWPKQHRDVLESFSGVCLAGLEERTSSRTFAWGGRYLEDVNCRETLFTEVGVVAENPPVVPAVYANSQFVFLGNTHPSVQHQFLSNFKERKLIVADTMNLWIETARPELEALIRDVDGLVLNDSEAAMLSGAKNAVTAANRILEMGPRFIIVKKGEHGAVLVSREGFAAVPAWPADEKHVVDPTGAGDSFAGGLMGHIATTGKTDIQTLRRAMQWGTVVASFTIERFGLEKLQEITRETLDLRMAEFRALTGANA